MMAIATPLARVARSRPYLVARVDQLRALRAPVRQEIVDVLAHLRCGTIAQVAAQLSRRPDSLYYHVRALLRAGLILEAGRIGTGRHVAAAYTLPARSLAIDYGPVDRRPARIGPVLDSLLRLGRRDVRRALARPTLRISGPTRDLWVARFRGRLTPAKKRELVSLLRRASDLLSSPTPPGARTTHVALAFAMTPL